MRLFAFERLQQTTMRMITGIMKQRAPMTMTMMAHTARPTLTSVGTLLEKVYRGARAIARDGDPAMAVESSASAVMVLIIMV